ncbi:hypothetical protein DFH08DRAFT_99386 [Mycena albidolilacea]|uniref:Uncharacterized protein n=1 Tax=Mycena albidolilacea TaxID=1033008 RepID=A0AAD7A8H8_9AGAR|nr:hypothetical protein DFH08DRAFT_99386 [Mycena albidolilacea]
MLRGRGFDCRLRKRLVFLGAGLDRILLISQSPTRPPCAPLLALSADYCVCIFTAAPIPRRREPSSRCMCGLGLPTRAANQHREHQWNTRGRTHRDPRRIRSYCIVLAYLRHVGSHNRRSFFYTSRQLSCARIPIPILTSEKGPSMQPDDHPQRRRRFPCRAYLAPLIAPRPHRRCRPRWSVVDDMRRN